MSVVKSSVIAFAVGDAMGVPIEFEKRETLMENPVTSMIGYGSYDVPSGVWSDDTSMVLATMDSFVKRKRVDYNDMAERFCDWVNNAKYTSTNQVFDIGITTKYSLIRYWNNKIDATECGGVSINENGNGSLMRILPIALFAYYKRINDDDLFQIVKNTSSITHAHEISILGCFIYVKYIQSLLSGDGKFLSYQRIKEYDYEKYFSNESIKAYNRILNNNINELDLDEIKSSGYVVHTLEAVLWIVLNTNDFTETVIGAINLGEDTDTIGAIASSIGGILYGFSSIPENWIKEMKNYDYLERMCSDFELTLINCDIKW